MNYPTVVNRRARFPVTISCRLICLALSLLLATGVIAQTAQTGSIDGRVFNATSGKYLKNAAVSVKGTAHMTLTSEYGDFHLSGIPAGTATVAVTYGGLETSISTVLVPAGGNVQLNVTMNLAGQVQAEKGAVILDPYVVSTQREFNAKAIATNEQRYAPNIKTVVSIDQFGDVNEGNAAEFLKYIPGVSVDYIGSNANTVLLRGLGAAYTGISVDGQRVATAAITQASRSVDFFTINTNNMSRVEVTKEPTPDQPADVLGGSINFISRSAFEYAKPTVMWQADLSMNSYYPDPFSKSAGPYNKDSFKTLPGGYFNYINPISKNLGITVNGLVSNQFNVQHRAIDWWLGDFSAFAPGSSLTNPFDALWTIEDSPSTVNRQTISTRVDWRPASNQLLSLTLQGNWYQLGYNDHHFAAAPYWGTNNFGPTYTVGTPSFSGADNQNYVRRFYNNSYLAGLKHTWSGREWKVESSASLALADAKFVDASDGHFDNVKATLVPSNNATPIQTSLYNINSYGPSRVEITDSTGALVDFRDLRNYRINSATTDPGKGTARVSDLQINASREFEVLSHAVRLKMGLTQRIETRDNRRTSTIYDFVGADGVANSADDLASAIADTNYINQDHHWNNWRNLNFISSYSAYDLFRAHPDYFKKQEATSYINAVNGSEFLRETTQAGYIQAETRFLSDRLRILGGFRYERTKDYGEGPLNNPNAAYKLNADGSFVRDSGGNKIPLATPGSLAAAQLIYRDRGYKGGSSYDGLYPSVNLSYGITDNTIARFAFSRTFGRPELSNIVPSTTIKQNDPTDGPSTYPGTITTSNLGLKPWQANNFDLSLEHYFKKGGLVSVCVFRKQISDFFATYSQALTAETAAQFGIPSQYIGWQVNTKVNGGDARVDGLEFAFNHKLDFLPIKWAERFSIDANATQLRLTSASNSADFSTFIKSTRNFGITYADSRTVVMLKWNYRGRQDFLNWKNAVFAGNDGVLHYVPRLYLDLNVEYKISKACSLFCNVRNLTNVEQGWDISGPTTPKYAQRFWTDEFGTQYVFGIKGTF